MDKKDEALKLALEALEGYATAYSDGDEAITAIRKALAEQPAQQEFVCSTGLCHYKAQPAQQINPETRTKDGLKYSPNYVAGYNDGLKAAQQQEPVAYLYHDARTPKDAHPWLHSTMLVLAADRRPGLRGETPLYTSPPASKPLTDEQIKIIWRDIDGSEGMLMRFARAIEAAHGIKGDT